MERGRWFDRKFTFGLTGEHLSGTIERLRGTPARLEERVRGCPLPLLIHRPGSSWSIQENIGHLYDLESLWYVRMDELAAGADTLTPADLQNRRTHDANHNEGDIIDLLRAFRTARMDVVHRLEGMTGENLLRSALHPRLKQPMNAIDLAMFVAEHDDHHLATITGIMEAWFRDHHAPAGVPAISERR